MDAPRKLLILGVGGNCVDILDIVLDINAAAGRTLYEPAGWLDDDPDQQGAAIHGLKVLGPLALAAQLPDHLLVNGIGSPFNHLQKPAIIAKTGAGPERFATLVHPLASVSRWAELGPGAVLFPGVAVHSGARVGAQVIALANSVINHDDLIGDHVCIASGACLSGAVTVGPRAYLGSGSSVRGGLRIGEGALVGMGAVVVADVEPFCVAAGNPARIIKRRDPA
ncbi:MAG: NeuD/PglB/VioB family sugar acetyltransferase [Thermodesulfobacteriota bacterium]